MDKRKGDFVTQKMRARLADNRDGRIATDQWLDLVTEPIVTLLVLLAPLAIILLPRFTLFALSLPMPLLVALLLALVGVPLILRARRYARAPIHFGILYAEDNPRPPWKVWGPQIFETENGKAIRFTKRLAPFMYFRPGHPYLVYFLEDGAGYVLLSVAPADHEDADKWRPSKFFERHRGRLVSTS